MTVSVVAVSSILAYGCFIISEPFEEGNGQFTHEDGCKQRSMNTR